MKIAFLFGADFYLSMSLFSALSALSALSERSNRVEIVAVSPAEEKAVSMIVTDEHIDGIIGFFVSDVYLEMLGIANMPVVNLLHSSPLDTCSNVASDGISAGTLAISVLRHPDVASYGYYGERGCAFSRDCRTSLEDGIPAVSICPSGILAPRIWEISSWLEPMSKPFAVFCANGILARNIVSACRESNLRIPEDIHLLSAGDMTVHSLIAGIRISAIAIDEAGIAEAAYHEIVRLVGNPRAEKKTCRVRCGPLITGGTLPPRRASRDVARLAAQYIHDHYNDDFSVDSLARHIAVSRRALEEKYRSRYGTSVWQAVIAVRLERAIELLERSDLSVTSIAQHCGFSGIHQLSYRFKAKFGISPTEYRSAIS